MAAKDSPTLPVAEKRKRAHQRLDELMDRAEREALTGEVFVKPRFRNGVIYHIDRGDTFGDNFGN